jgi:sugar lactone lactonase YvrE
VGSSCSLNVNYSPSAVGLQTGALVLSTAAGAANTAYLSAVGLGGANTIDPGVVTLSTATFVKPSGVAAGPGGLVFVLDASANTLTEFATGATGAGTLVSTGTLTLSAPNSVAVDGAGDIFIADTGNNRVVEIPAIAGVLNNAGTVALSPVLKKPLGVAVDAQGDLYVADTGDNNLLYVPAINGALNFAASRSLGSALTGPSAVTIDPGGNVFLAETGNNDVLEFAAPLGSSAQVKVASGLNAPSALATDASSSLFVADSGSQSIFRFPNVGGNLGTKSLAGSSVAAPVGLATDSAGNLYVTDATNALFEIVSRTTAALNFGGWNVGTTSTSLTGSVSSSGNQSVVFATPSYTLGGATAAGFKVTADTCAGTTVVPGSACALTANFTPPVTELNAQENLTLVSNAAGAGAVLQLIGTGAQITPSTLALVLTSPKTTGPLNVGVAATFTATVGTGSNTATPGGSVSFLVNGTPVGSAKVANGAASITLPTGLPAGAAVIVTANYSGDSINYSGSTSSLTLVVNALPDTLSLTITAPYNNPPSAVDVTANTKGPVIPLIATLVPQGTIIPAGFVTFYAGTTSLGSASVLPGTGGAFQATLNTTALRAGTTNQVENNVYLTNYNITAVYSGDTSYGPSTSNVSPIAIVSGPTFTITPANPTIVASTTTAGGPASGSTTLTVNSYGGWTGILNFTCSGLPTFATCAPFPGGPLIAFSTPSATVPPTTVDFIINTNLTPITPTAGSMAWWFSALGGLMLLVLRRKVQRAGFLRSSELFCALGVLLLLTGSVFGMSGCSGGGYPYVTPAGSSVVSVKVNAAQLVSGSTNGTTQAPDVNTPTLKITLTVQ